MKNIQNNVCKNPYMNYDTNSYNRILTNPVLNYQNQYTVSFGNSPFANFNTANQLTYLPQDTLQIQQSKVTVPEVEKNGMSTGAKWAISIGTLATAGIAIVMLTKGKKLKILPEQSVKLQALVSSGKLDEQYLEIFKSTEHLNGNKFIKETYNKITKMMGYENSAPKLNIINDYRSSNANPNFITISPKAFDTKAKQFSVIRHELEHFRQQDLIYRAFGKEAYIEAKIIPSIKKLKLNDDFCKSKMGKIFNELSEQELTTYKNKVRTNIEKETEKLENLLKNKGKINSNLPEYAEAQKYLEATKNYKTPTMVLDKVTSEYINELKKTNPKKFKLAQKLLKEYKNNLLEIGAIEQGTRIENMYELFLSVLKI